MESASTKKMAESKKLQIEKMEAEYDKKLSNLLDSVRKPELEKKDSSLKIVEEIRQD